MKNTEVCRTSQKCESSCAKPSFRKNRKLWGILAVFAAAAATSAVTAPAALANPVTAHHDCGTWGTRIEGAPESFGAGDRGGDYLWHDNTGFHLRVTNRGDGRDVYTGVITSPTPMHITPIGLEPSDYVSLSPDGRILGFMFIDYGHIDGVDFTTDCASSITVGPLTGRYGHQSPGRVYLGAHEIHPDHVPFTIHRWDN